MNDKELVKYVISELKKSIRFPQFTLMLDYGALTGMVEMR
jgi:hypothetical protein